MCVRVCALSQRVAERCLRRTGIGWLGSGGGGTDDLLSSLRRRRMSASRHELGDFGRVFTGATFTFVSLERNREKLTRSSFIETPRRLVATQNSPVGLTAVCTAPQGEAARTGPIWTSSLSSQELLTVLAAETCREPEPPETSGHTRSETHFLAVSRNQCF